MFQNTFVNWYFLAPEFGVHRDVTKLICTMCVIGGCMGCFLKTPWPVWLGAPVTMLDGLAKTLPDFFSFSTAGTPESCMYESMCGPKVGPGRGGRWFRVMGDRAEALGAGGQAVSRVAVTARSSWALGAAALPLESVVCCWGSPRQVGSTPSIAVG